MKPEMKDKAYSRPIGVNLLILLYSALGLIFTIPLFLLDCIYLGIRYVPNKITEFLTKEIERLGR